MRKTRKEFDDVELGDKINMLSKLTNMIYKYGLGKVASALLIFMLLIATGIVFLNQKAIVEKIITEQKEVAQMTNAKNLQFRVKEVNPRVDAILYKLLAETDADRAFVFEMHNGTDNPSGLPFAYADMSYERTIDDTIETVIQENKSMNLASYPMATYLMTYKYFKGCIDDVRAIDKRLANKLSNGGVYYVMIYSIRGNDVNLGCVGVSYIHSKPKNEKLGEASLFDASQRLSILLDINSNIEKIGNAQLLK